MEFTPSKADAEAWMQPSVDGDCYECIAVYVDDLAIATNDPAEFCETLQEVYNFKLKVMDLSNTTLDVPTSKTEMVL